MDWPAFIRKLLHDLVNPLAGSKMHLELLVLGASTPEEATPELESQLERIQKIIEETRELVALDASIEAPALSKTELQKIDTRLGQIFPDIDYVLPVSFLAGLCIPARYVEVIFTVLLKNACEAEASEIMFEISENTILCRDNGSPFTENNRERALTPFFSSKPDATGLGLNVVQYILENYQGEISVQPHTSPKGGVIVLRFLQ